MRLAGRVTSGCSRNSARTGAFWSLHPDATRTTRTSTFWSASEFPPSPVASVHRPLSTTIPQAPNAPAARSETAATAVSIQGVSKTFRLPHRQYSTLKERALHPFRSTTYDELHAVQDISLEIAEGEFFGIVGRNGSGKSTLLKCIAGIYGVETGRISIAGSAVAVHRARRRLQPRSQRARQRRHQRDHARPQPQAGDGALRARRRLRRTRGVHGPAPEELLLGDARAPRVRHRDPGRRRDPADRRGARRRRRRLPAEVLRGVLPAQARRPHDRVRLPRHVLGRALLQPRDADGARR